MNILTPVAQLMSTNLKTVSPSDSLLVVRDFFKDFNIHHLPVVSYTKIVGIISKEDYLNFQHGCVGEESSEEKKRFQLTTWEARHIMTTKLATIESTDPIRTALEVFKLNRFHALPVVDNNVLVGILTTHDIIKYVATATATLTDYKTKNT